MQVDQARRVKPPPGLSCWDGQSVETLKEALSPPATTCVEADLIEECDCGDVIIEQRAPGQLTLIVTTRSAYRHSIVKAFIAAIERRTAFSEDLRDRIYSSAQEALMNAVFHGNLRIDPNLRDSLEGLLAAQEAIEAKLTSPEVARAKIRVVAIWNATTLNVVVQDSGKGYDAAVPSNRKSRQPGDHASGRGLDILEAFSDKVTVSNGGTTVSLEFRR
ncbi:MAG: ATP-binding protein [Bradyrhizobium sp.]|uniref:ATP-binding protein n=1 Tax=Bradyrhizobium sp. TaxID=376 RepID=UPI001E096CFF|nr:ATP-binding protein [Bradyrhizobium sp.]MBV9561017.1 ATP-binding protein [Bradyrhizobium sp.]